MLSKMYSELGGKESIWTKMNINKFNEYGLK